jgi:DNA-binding transcriptional ArsR family regulator
MKNVSEQVSGMKHGLTDLCYGFFSTLANPTRLAIIELLDEAPMSVTQMVEALGQEQSMVSHNLRPLVQCKFVKVARQGKSRVYSLNHESLDPMLQAVESHASKYCGNRANCPARRPSEASRKE